MADQMGTGPNPTEAAQAGQPKLTVSMVGPITDTYQGDVEALIKTLNELRSTEIVAWLQYKHHAYMAVSLAMPGVRDEFEEHAAQEEHHADMLAERIQQLNGVPVFDPAEIGQLAARDKISAQEAPTLRGMIEEDLALERQQIRVYQQLIRNIGFQDPTTRRILEDILMDTEHHATEMQNLLDREAPVERRQAS